jgi:hypothetical protein
MHRLFALALSLCKLAYKKKRQYWLVALSRILELHRSWETVAWLISTLVNPVGWFPC